MKVQDLTQVSDIAYKLAEVIGSGNYKNILVYEFHQQIDPSKYYNSESGLEEFRRRCGESYSAFIDYGIVDEVPAIISISFKIADEWFIVYECGSNFYLGFGPCGILELRKSCAKNKVPIFYLSNTLEEWLKENFDQRGEKTKRRNSHKIEFDKIINVIQHFCIDIQRRPEHFNQMKEESLRDLILKPLNAAFKGRGNAEAKNGKGKTDILIRTKDGLNELIFELKIWNGIKSLEVAIDQLLSYLRWQNNYAGLLIFYKQNNLSATIRKVYDHLVANYGQIIRNQYLENEFKFKIPNPNDRERIIEVYLLLVNIG